MESILNSLNNSLGGPDIKTPDLEPKLLDFIDPFEQRGQEQAQQLVSSSTADPTASFLSGALAGGPSLSTQMQPINFNPEQTQLDRYTNSSYSAELGFDPRRNNEELYASRQTWGDTMGNAFAGAGRLASNTFLEGWKGWGRLADAMTSFDASKLQPDETEMYQMAKIQEDVMNKYAIFRSADSEKSVFNKQFFGDLVQNSGFAVGAIAQALSEELLTFGASSLFSATKLGMRFMKGVDKLQDVEEFARLNKSLGDIYKQEGLAKTIWKGFQKFNPIGSTTNAIEKAVVAGKNGAGAAQIAALTFGGFRRTLSEANMARSEAIFEAAGTYKELKDRLTEQHLERTGELPVGEDLERIDRVSKDASSDNFNVNFGMLFALNRFQFDNMLGHFNAERRLFKNVGQYADDVLKVSGKVADKELTKVYQVGSLGALGAAKEIATDFGKKEAAWQVSKFLGKNLFKWETSEGLQELFQEGSNKGLQDYYYDLYHGKKGYSGKTDAIMSSVQNPLADTQGMKTFLMGAVTGRLLSPINFTMGKVQERMMTTDKQREEIKKDKTATVAAINEFYKNPYAVLKDEIANFKVQNKVAATMQEAVGNKDKYTYYNSRDTAFAKAVSAAKKAGMVSSLIDTIRGQGESFSVEDAKEAYGLDPTVDSAKSVKEYFNKIANDVETFNKTWETLNEKYGDLIQPDLYSEGSQGQKDAQMLKSVLDDYIEMLATNSFKAKSAIERANALYTRAAANPNLGGAASAAYKVLGSQPKMLGEMDLLIKEIDNLKQVKKRTPEEAQTLKYKERQLQAISKWFDSWQNLSNRDETNMSKREQRYAKDAYKRFINYKTEEAGLNTALLSNTDIDETYEDLLEYIQLNNDSEEHLNAYNFLADPTSIVTLANRMKAAKKVVQGQLAKEAKDEATKSFTDSLTGAVAPEDGENITDPDTSDLTEDVEDAANAPEGGTINVETLLADLKEGYFQVIKSQLEISEEGMGVMNPAAFIGFSTKGREILLNYGVSNKDITFNIAHPSRDNYTSVEFTYTGAKSSNNVPTEVAEPIEVEPTPEVSSEDQPVPVTPEEAVQVEQPPVVAEAPTETPVVVDEEQPDPEQEEYEANPNNSLEVSGVKFVLGNYIVPTDGSEVVVKIVSVGKDRVWVQHGNESEYELTDKQLADFLTNNAITVSSNPKAKTMVTPVATVTEAQKKEVQKAKEAQEEDVDLDALEYTTDNVDIDYVDGTNPDTSVEEDSRTPINSGSKINNASDNFVVYTDKKGVRRLKRTDGNESYPLILGTSRIQEGTPLMFEIDSNIADFDDYDYVQQTGITKRKKEDFFNADGKIKEEAINDFPVAIYTMNNGKKIKLGYLPTVKFVTARYSDSGVLAHTKERIVTPDGTVIDNLAIQRQAILDHRKALFNGFKKYKATVFTSTVIAKSVGVLRTDGSKKPLKQALSKNTQVAIIKQGKVHVTDKYSESNLYVPNIITDGKANGWPVAIIPTPTGKRLASLVTVPVLKDGHIDFILGSWRAFHNYNVDVAAGKNSKDSDLAIIQAVYKAYGIEFIDGETADFARLSKYVNDYITHTSSKAYNPISQGKVHFNITPKGYLSIWQVNTGDKKKDSLIIGNLDEISEEKINKFYDIAANLRYSIRFGTEQSAGIGNDKLMTDLTINPDTGALEQSQPMTYNEYMLQTLETTLEEGRPYDEANIDADELVHFSNPVVVFGNIDSETPSSGTKPEVAPKAPAPVEPTIDPRVLIENERKKDKQQNKDIPESNYILPQKSPKEVLIKFREYLTDVLGWVNMPISYNNNELVLDYLGTELRVSAKVVQLGAGNDQLNLNNVSGVTSNFIEIDVNSVIDAKYDAELVALEGKVVDSAYINVTDTSKSQAPLSQEEALAKFMDMDFGQQFGANQTVNKDLIKGNDDELKSIATTTKKLENENKLNKKCN
jgi:hypothetical protein